VWYGILRDCALLGKILVVYPGNGAFWYIFRANLGFYVYGLNTGRGELRWGLIASPPHPHSLLALAASDVRGATTDIECRKQQTIVYDATNFTVV